MLNAISIWRVSNWFYKRNIKILAKILKFIIFLLYNSSIPYECHIGKGTKLGYSGIAVVIHKKAIIGENCMIAQCVTIGGQGGGKEGVPKIGNNVYIGAGAKVLGDIKIGDNVIIAGIPAKIIRKN